MGGSAFKRAAAPGQPSLYTPRMSPAEYTRLKDIYLSKIRTIFPEPAVKIEVLKEAPEKLDYGDMDLFIGLDQQVDFLNLANALGATGLIIHSTGDVQKCTLGVPIDGSPSSKTAVLYETINTNSKSRSPSPVRITIEEYAQIDLNIIPKDLVEWHIFESAYSDLNALIGHIVTNLGFTLTNYGFFLRMKELDDAKTIERANVADEDGKLFLTRAPKRLMGFMGLSQEAWDAGFQTMEQFYAWLGASRMIHPMAVKRWRNKGHERRREQNRSVYSRFYFEWLPERMPELTRPIDKDEQQAEISKLRVKYLEEALDFFDTRATYNKMHRNLLLTLHNFIAANLLRPLIAKHSGAKEKKLGEIVRAFRRFVRFTSDCQPCVFETAHTDADSQLHLFLDNDATALDDECLADEFVKCNWERLKELERARGKTNNIG